MLFSPRAKATYPTARLRAGESVLPGSQVSGSGDGTRSRSTPSTLGKSWNAASQGSPTSSSSVVTARTVSSKFRPDSSITQMSGAFGSNGL